MFPAQTRGEDRRARWSSWHIVFWFVSDFGPLMTKLEPNYLYIHLKDTAIALIHARIALLVRQAYRHMVLWLLRSQPSSARERRFESRGFDLKRRA